MTVVRVKGFKIFPDRHGRMRCYHRNTKTPVDLKKAPLGSAEFFAECARISSSSKLRLPAKAGTLGLLMTKFKGHPAFLELAPHTRKDYQRIFDYLRPIEGTLLTRFDPPLVARIRDEAGKRGRRTGNYTLSVLRILFAWGKERGLIETNPAIGVKNIRKPRGTPDANRPWSDAERHAVIDQAPAPLRPPLAIMMFTGLGPGDTLKLPRTFYKNGTIATARSKTGEPVYWPAPAPLRRILEQAAPHSAMTLCANSSGKPWTESGFRASWHTYRSRLRAAGVIGPGLTLYGLRHTLAVILRELGYDERTIADALGQRTIEMARLYARGADLTRKMEGVAKNFEREVNRRRTKVSTRTEKVSNLEVPETKRS